MKTVRHLLAWGALLGVPAAPLAADLEIDLDYVDTGSAPYLRFESWVGAAVGGNPGYAFSATDAVYMYRITGQAQYANIYMRGALTAGLLDIRLLELSGGQRGLQDLIVDLAHRFGKQRAFPESTFVDTLAAMTSPEIRHFFNRYVWDSQRLPIADYYGKLGIRLIEAPDGTPERFEIESAATPAQKALRDAWLGRKRRPAS